MFAGKNLNYFEAVWMESRTSVHNTGNYGPFLYTVVMIA